jgi:hypothetical protein
VVKPTSAIFLGDFAPLRETTARHPHLPLRAFRVLRGAPVALARTEYRSAEYEYEYEYEYDFANQENERKMRKRQGRLLTNCR